MRNAKFWQYHLGTQAAKLTRYRLRRSPLKRRKSPDREKAKPAPHKFRFEPQTVKDCQLTDLAGRSGRARTCDPRFWRPVLYQLSYTPTEDQTSPPIRAVSSIGNAPIARAKRSTVPDRAARGLPTSEHAGTAANRPLLCGKRPVQPAASAPNFTLTAKNKSNRERSLNAQTAARHAAAPQTPPLPQAKPESLGLSSVRLQRMSDAFKRDIDKGTIPGVTVMVARRGQIGWFDALGSQNPAASQPMAHESIFRIFSMTKPIVSVGIMMLLEEGHFLLNDPIAKYIPEFANQKVGIENNGKLDLVALSRPITIQDLLRHTSGITYDHTGNGLVQQLYQQSRLRSRKISNAEHAALVASMPLMCQPGTEWNYSRSTDILGRLIEVVSGKTLSAFLTERILAPLQMAETAFHTGAENAGRLAEPFPTDPWSGDNVQLFNMLERPAMESGGGGLVSTTMDYARFCQMLLNGGALEGIS